MPTDNDLGRHIAALRDRRGLTQAELGKAIGLSRQRVTQLEAGRKAWPSPEIFNALAKVLDVPVQELLRAGGLTLPDSSHEQLDWVISQMDDDGREQLADIGRALLPRHLRQQRTAPS